MTKQTGHPQYTIPTRSLRTARIISLVFGVAEIAGAGLLYACTSWTVLAAILAVVGLFSLVRVFTYSREYRRRP